MKRALLALFALAPPSPARAHDSWLLVEPSRPVLMDSVRVAFSTGEAFPESEHATRPQRVARWVHLSPSGARGVQDFENEELSLVSRAALAEEGAHLFGVALHPHPIELPAAEFNGYLEEEGQQEALADRRRRGELERPARELYTKHAKTLVRVGRDPTRGFTRRLGHALELVPESDPADWRAGQEISVRVYLHGQPRGGIRVAAAHDGAGAHLYAAVTRSDASGRARLVLPTGGLWYLKAFHLSRAVDRSKADWLSAWATLSFAVWEEPAVERALAESRAVHGGVGPWVLLGHRMGQHALAVLGLERGGGDLEIVHESPPEVQYTCVLDGLQAATGASLGRLSLSRKDAPADATRTVFRRRSTGQALILRPSAAFSKEMLDLPRERLGAAAKATAARDWRALFTVEGPGQ